MTFYRGKKIETVKRSVVAKGLGEAEKDEWVRCRGF